MQASWPCQIGPDRTVGSLERAITPARSWREPGLFYLRAEPCVSIEYAVASVPIEALPGFYAAIARRDIIHARQPHMLKKQRRWRSRRAGAQTG